MPNGMGDRDHEIQATILRGWQQNIELCEQLAAGYHAAGDADNGAYLDHTVLRYRQAVDGARDAWASADRVEALRAITAHDAAWDAETAACDAPTVVLEV